MNVCVLFLASAGFNSRMLAKSLLLRGEHAHLLHVLVLVVHEEVVAGRVVHLLAQPVLVVDADVLDVLLDLVNRLHEHLVFAQRLV